MTKRVRTLLALAIGGLLCAAGFGWYRTTPVASEATVVAAPAERTELVAMARLEPAGEVIGVAAPEDEVIGAVTAAEGQQVTAGQPLAELASHELRRSEVAAARARLDRLAVQEYDVSIQQAAIRVAEAELAGANEDLERQRRLFAEGLASQQEVTAATLRVRKTEEVLAQAKIQLERLGAERRLARAELEQGLAVAERQLERTMVRAPIAGRILKLSARAGERVGLAPIAQLADTSRMVAIAEVHANDIRLVRPGQPAQFVSPALDAPIAGTVERLGELLFRNDIFGDDPTAPTGLRVFEIRIALSTSTAAARFTHLEGQVRIALNAGDAR